MGNSPFFGAHESSDRPLFKASKIGCKNYLICTLKLQNQDDILSTWTSYPYNARKRENAMSLRKYNDSRIIQRIARDVGLSVSSVYGILNGRLGFSNQHLEKVKELADAYGLVSLPTRDAFDLTIGVILPSHPRYFWDEATVGIKKAIDAYRARGVQIQIRFHYFPKEYDKWDDDPVEDFRANPCDGYILFPVWMGTLWDFFASLPSNVPIALFNDKPKDAAQRSFFENRGACAFIGADNFAEGQQAASVLKPHLAGAQHLIAFASDISCLLLTSATRIAGFTCAMQEVNPTVNIESVHVEKFEKITPSLIARKLDPYLQHGRLDGVYVSSGFAHVAAAALCKVCRKNGLDAHTIPCIGHEFAPSDKSYLLDGLLRGYVRQDVYRQGWIAVEQVVENLLHGTSMKDTLVCSSVYIR